MIRRGWLLVLVGMLFLAVPGCMVTESTYLKKVEEAGSLEQGFAACREEVERLGKQNGELAKKVQEQQAQIVEDFFLIAQSSSPMMSSGTKADQPLYAWFVKEVSSHDEAHLASLKV